MAIVASNSQIFSRHRLTVTDISKEEMTDFKGVQFKKNKAWASLVVQWLRVCLPVQGTRVRALVWEDPTCRGAARPVSHNY